MPRNLPPKDRKRRTRAHVLADLSVNYVERQALRCGYTVQRLSPDYGLDLQVITFDDDGFLEDGLLWIQLKATDRIQLTRDGTAALVRIERRDILAWMKQLYPVFLVLYDGARDMGFYLLIQDHFAGPDVFAKLSGRTVTVSVPTENLMNEAAMREFARVKAAVSR